VELNSTKSFGKSRAMTFATAVACWSVVTRMSEQFSITWAFVTIAPPKVTKNPVPALISCSCFAGGFDSSFATAASGAGEEDGFIACGPAGAEADTHVGNETGAPARANAEISSVCRRTMQPSSPSHWAIIFQYGIPISSAFGWP
jgi:hypothetical protein